MKRENIEEIRLSVVMPNFNHSVFLKERIASLLDQMAENDEFIVIDDASTDDSCLIIEKFALKDHRLLFIKNKQNQGTIRSVNVGVQRARGKYLLTVASDDRVLNGFIDKTITVLEKNPEVGLCCSDCAMVFEGNPDKIPNQIYTTRLIENATTVQVFPSHKILDVFRKTTFWIPGHTTIFKRHLLAKYGGFFESIGYLTDWFLLHAIALEAGASYIPEELAVWRQEPKTLSGSQRADPNIAYLCQANVFAILREKKYRHLHRLFRKSGLLDCYARTVVAKLIQHPFHWSFVLRLIKKSIVFRIKKLRSG